MKILTLIFALELLAYSVNFCGNPVTLCESGFFGDMITSNQYKRLSPKRKSLVVKFLREKNIFLTVDDLKKIPKGVVLTKKLLDSLNTKVPVAANVPQLSPRLCHDKKRALNKVLQENKAKISPTELTQLYNIIEHYKNDGRKPFFIKSRVGLSPYSIEFQEDGEIFINLKSPSGVDQSGSFKKVKRSIRYSDLSVWVNLKLRNLSAKNQEDFLKEKAIINALKDVPGTPGYTYSLKYLGKDNIIKLTGKQKQFNGGNLYQNSINKKILNRDVKPMVRSLLTTVAGIHQRGVVHHDIKPENILVQNNPEGKEFILGDYGAAITRYPVTSTVGTLPFLSPETYIRTTRMYPVIYFNKAEAELNDSYAIGLSLLEVMYPEIIGSYITTTLDLLNKNQDLHSHYANLKYQLRNRGGYTKVLLNMIHPQTNFRWNVRRGLRMINRLN